MSEEVSLSVYTPIVTRTGISKRNRPVVEVRANDGDALSIHYEAAEGEVPTVREKLLVAVLAAPPRSYLCVNVNETGEKPPEPIQFEAVSAVPYNSSDPSRQAQHDTLRIGAIDYNGMTRLHVSMSNESGGVTHAAAVLSKGQVTSMIAALLAIYPRLEEN